MRVWRETVQLLELTVGWRYGIFRIGEIICRIVKAGFLRQQMISFRKIYEWWLSHVQYVCHEQHEKFVAAHQRQGRQSRLVIAAQKHERDIAE